MPLGCVGRGGRNTGPGAAAKGILTECVPWAGAGRARHSPCWMGCAWKERFETVTSSNTQPHLVCTVIFRRLREGLRSHDESRIHGASGVCDNPATQKTFRYNSIRPRPQGCESRMGLPVALSLAFPASTQQRRKPLQSPSLPARPGRASCARNDFACRQPAKTPIRARLYKAPLAAGKQRRLAPALRSFTKRNSFVSRPPFLSRRMPKSPSALCPLFLLSRVCLKIS